MEAFGKWLVEEMLGPLFLAFLAAIGATFWKIMHKISTGDRELHQRINKVRDEFVKNEDLHRVEDSLNKRLDEIKADGHARSKDMKEYIKEELDRRQ